MMRTTDRPAAGRRNSWGRRSLAVALGLAALALNACVALPAATPAVPAASPLPRTAAPVSTAPALATPAATAVGQRDPEITEVTLDVFSGRPNPTWTLTAAQTGELRALLDALPDATCKSLALNLGYRGFVVELGQSPLLSNEYRLRVAGGQVRWGDPWTPDAAKPCASDVEGRVARFLLESGREQLDDGLYGLAAQDIGRSALPEGWQEYADSALGISFAYSPAWELTQDTGQSRLFHVRQTEPAGPTFPVFYVTVLPQGFTNEDFSAYNFWSEADVAVARALDVGQAGEVSGAPGYNVYSRLPDVTVAGLPGLVMESDKVWEGGPGVKDRRVLVTRGDATYMFGTYYSTPEELQVFETALSTVVFAAAQNDVVPTP